MVGLKHILKGCIRSEAGLECVKLLRSVNNESFLMEQKRTEKNPCEVENIIAFKK